MTLDALIIVGGAFVAILPFLGFPSSWDSVLMFIAGIFIISLGVTLRRRKGERQEAKRGAFIENAPVERAEHDAY